MRRSLSTLVALLALGCADKTAILVEVTSDDLSVPADVDALHFVAVSDGGRRLDETYALGGTWPHSLSILPASGDSSRVTITVTGMHQGVARVRRVVPTAFDRGTTRRVIVTLTRDCVDVVCGEGIDCVSGMCVGQPPLDGGVDAGMDAGSSDAGLDGGMLPEDAGADGGPRDAGTDGGPPDPPDAGTDAGPPPPLELLFSEYVEGSSNNKALEIVNLGATPAALSRCSIRRFANGGTAPTAIPLAGTLAPGAVHVVCNGSLEGALTLCDQTSGTVTHNGDDAYDLFCDGAVMDTFGQIGVDPGVEWTGGGLGTAEYVLTRRCTVLSGDTVGSDAFDPSVQWQGSAWVDAATSLAGLGNRSECP